MTQRISSRADEALCESTARLGSELSATTRLGVARPGSTGGDGFAGELRRPAGQGRHRQERHGKAGYGAVGCVEAALVATGTDRIQEAGI